MQNRNPGFVTILWAFVAGMGWWAPCPPAGAAGPEDPSALKASSPPAASDKPVMLTGYARLAGEKGQCVGHLLRLRILLPDHIRNTDWKPAPGGGGRPHPAVYWQRDRDSLLIGGKAYRGVGRFLVSPPGPPTFVPPWPKLQHYDALFLLPGDVKVLGTALRLQWSDPTGPGRPPAIPTPADRKATLTAQEIAKRRAELRAGLCGVEPATPEAIAERNKVFPFQTVTPKAYLQIRVNLLGPVPGVSPQMLSHRLIKQVRIEQATSEGKAYAADVDSGKPHGVVIGVEACLTRMPTVYLRLEGLQEWVRCAPFERPKAKPTGKVPTPK